MPRPTKCRRVSRMPLCREFQPAGESSTFVTLCVEEYEAIRLIDWEGLSQEACGKQMQVARATVQLIYDSARKKLAQALVSGVGIRIEGGNYRLSEQNEKGAFDMKIAVTYENGAIFQHFGHTQQFKLYEVADGRIVSSQVLDTNGSGHGALAGFLTAQGVDALICGGIGGGAQMALAQAGIKLFGGVSGDADAAVAAFVAGNLAFDPAAKCDHHDHGHDHGHSCGGHGHHHDHGHTCGDHGCGQGHGHGHGHCGHH